MASAATPGSPPILVLSYPGWTVESLSSCEVCLAWQPGRAAYDLFPHLPSAQQENEL